jgi:hypothetical protein
MEPDMQTNSTAPNFDKMSERQLHQWLLDPKGLGYTASATYRYHANVFLIDTRNGEHDEIAAQGFTDIHALRNAAAATYARITGDEPPAIENRNRVIDWFRVGQYGLLFVTLWLVIFAIVSRTI